LSKALEEMGRVQLYLVYKKVQIEGDADSLLFLVEQDPAAHNTGSVFCFYAISTGTFWIRKPLISLRQQLKR